MSDIDIALPRKVALVRKKLNIVLNVAYCDGVEKPYDEFYRSGQKWKCVDVPAEKMVNIYAQLHTHGLFK